MARICVIRAWYFPVDERVNREIDALVRAGHEVDLICTRMPGQPRFEQLGRVAVYRLPIARRRAGLLRYFFEFVTFQLAVLQNRASTLSGGETWDTTSYVEWDQYMVDNDNGVLRLLGGAFAPGYRNYRVACTAGYCYGSTPNAPWVPPDLESCCVELVKQMFRFREGMIYLSPAPLYHSAPQASVSATIRLGSTAVIMEHFDPEQFIALVERYRVTHSQMVPTMFSRLLKLPDEVRDRYDVSSLECIIHAAAPCPVPVKQQMIEWVGPIIIEYYGATEANGFTWCDSEQWLAHPGTVGKPIVGQLQILDDDGKPCPTGTPGTVWFAGATNFEYFNDPDKTKESRDESGTSSTVGDVGYVDEDGYLYLTDRKTYMIISGGVNIYPQETENLLITHPKVLDAAVIGVPNEDLGEEVKAVVQAADGVEPGTELERELIAFCRENLAHFKCPRSVDFEAELPRLPTGKLYKRLLRDRYWQQRGSVIV